MIVAVSPPWSHQNDGHENKKQGRVMEHQQPVLAEESPHCLKRVAGEGCGTTSDPLGVVVAQVHGNDVVGHIGSSKPNKLVDQPVTVYRDRRHSY